MLSSRVAAKGPGNDVENLKTECKRQDTRNDDECLRNCGMVISEAEANMLLALCYWERDSGGDKFLDFIRARLSFVLLTSSLFCRCPSANRP